MTIVMFEAIAEILQCIERFIFNRPSTSSSPHDFHAVHVIVKGQASDPAVLIDSLSIRIKLHVIKKIHQQIRVGFVEWNTIHIEKPMPMASLVGIRKSFYFTLSVQVINRFEQGGVITGLGNGNEVVPVRLSKLECWPFGIKVIQSLESISGGNAPCLGKQHCRIYQCSVIPAKRERGCRKR